MLTERWGELKQLVDAALDQPVHERRRWLERESTDPELGAEALAILEADLKAGEFLEHSAADAGLALLGEGGGVPEAGARIGPYEIVGSLGAGGMGHVLLAVRADDAYRQQVAIKLVDRATDAASLRRFRQERQILADLEHAHIARLYDGGSTGDGRPYLVMERVEGEPIDRFAETHGLTLAERLELFRKVLAAVAFAHRSLVIHLDLKPSNILVGSDGEPKLLDFGIARVMNPAASGETTLGNRPMTLDYASPEQLRGERLTTASDVYSLGVVLYRLLTGTVPHARGTGPVLDLATEPPPTPPSRRGRENARPPRWVSQLAGDLDAIALKALRRETATRYGSVEQLDEDLGRYLAGLPVAARRGTWRYRASRFARRHWLALTLTTALILALVSAVVVGSVQARRVAAERDQAAQARSEAEEVGAFLADLLGRFDPGAVEGISVTVPELLDRGVAVLDDTLEPPAVRARLLHTLGVAYHAWGRYDDAERMLHEALELRESLARRSPGEVAESLNALGALVSDRGDKALAMTYHRRALAIVTSESHRDALAEAATLQLLGVMQFDLGDPEAALASLERACALRRRLQGEVSMETADCLLAQASVAVQGADAATAEQLALESVRIFERLRPDGHPDVADAWVAVARARLEQGEYERAGEPLAAALEVRQRTLPAGHLKISEALSDLAAWHNKAGTPEQAEPLLRQSLGIIRAHSAEDNERSALMYYSLGTSLKLQGRPGEAESALRRSVEILRRIHPEGRQLLHPLGALAELCIAQGRAVEAQALAAEALAQARAALPAGHRLVVEKEAVLARARALESSG